MRCAWLAVLVGGCSDDGGPRLESVTPAAALPGARVTLVGSRLCGEPPNCETAAGAVQIGLDLPTVIATVIEYEDERALVEIPSSASIGPTDIVVTVNERASNALAFEVLAP